MYLNLDHFFSFNSQLNIWKIFHDMKELHNTMRPQTSFKIQNFIIYNIRSIISFFRISKKFMNIFGLPSMKPSTKYIQQKKNKNDTNATWTLIFFLYFINIQIEKIVKNQINNFYKQDFLFFWIIHLMLNFFLLSWIKIKKILVSKSIFFYFTVLYKKEKKINLQTIIEKFSMKWMLSKIHKFIIF